MQRSVRRSYADEWTACFQVRARDLAGNLSAWSPSRCTSVDGRDPEVTRATIDTSRLRTLGFVFRASDHFGISHYSVRYRRGANAARWIAPSEWRHLATTSVRLGRDGGRTCFEVTAVDRVGHRDRVVRCVRR
ncbi:hypothetical protein [Nocardioides sp.]|uniref:hypothetical protein n=1 Tax=Nocardioides sp. TaxID=35761 RepID=UPI003514F58C